MSEDPEPKKRIISHTEVTSFGECDLQHFFAFILNLRPLGTKKPLQHGIIGHEMMDAFWNTLKDTHSFNEAFLASCSIIDGMRRKKEIDIDVAKTLEVHMQMFFQQHHDLPWNIIEVEKKMVVELPDKPYNFGFKADIIAEITEGMYKGKLAIIDWKYLYNFWNRSNFRQYVQIPRYIWGTRQLGYNVSLGQIAQIRYRPFQDYTKADLFDWVDIKPTEARIENAMLSFFKKADRIAERYEMPQQEALNVTDPVYSPGLVCKYCDFSEPCSKRLDGQSIKTELKVNFKKSDYGYN